MEDPVRSAPAPEEVDTLRAALLCRAEVSVRYHRSRERFFDWSDRAAKVASILVGSGAALKLAGDERLVLAGFVVAAINAASLAIGLSERARRHAGLAQRFAEVLADITERGVDAAATQQLRDWDAAMRRIEADEPAPMPTVQAVAQRDYERTLGAKWEPISPLRVALGHVLPIQPYPRGIYPA